MCTSSIFSLFLDPQLHSFIHQFIQDFADFSLTCFLTVWRGIHQNSGHLKSKAVSNCELSLRKGCQKMRNLVRDDLKICLHCRHMNQPHKGFHKGHIVKHCFVFCFPNNVDKSVYYYYYHISFVHKQMTYCKKNNYHERLYHSIEISHVWHSYHTV